MPSIRHILFPYDFSDQGLRTVPFVRALASRLGAHITVYAVVPPTFESVPEGMGTRIRVGDDVQDWHERLQSQLDRALVSELSGLPVERVADGGDPSMRIVHFSQQHAVDLIMMPTHGRGRFRALLVGSVASKVLHDAECPVWTAAHAEMQTALEIPRTILCAVDGTPATLGLLRWATDFSTTVGARLHVLHVVGSITDWPSLSSERRLQEHVREEARDSISSMMKSAGVDAPLHVVVGEVPTTTTAEVQQRQADLVIIGRGVASEPFGRLRSHAFGIIQSSPCPVLSI